jgi:hypothetical protein
MRIGRFGLVTLVLMTSASTIGDVRVTSSEAELRTATIGQEPLPPPPPRFIPFRSLEKRLEIREEEILIVGEMEVECAPVYSQTATFVVSSLDTPFVTLIDDSCLCPTSGSKFRSLIRLAPRRGDKGKYRVVICGNACLGNGNECFAFDIKVKAAL